MPSTVPGFAATVYAVRALEASSASIEADSDSGTYAATTMNE